MLIFLYIAMTPGDLAQIITHHTRYRHQASD